jgi:hypothetical protein
MDRTAQAQFREDLEPFQHRAVRRARVVARRVAQKQLRADHPGLRHGAKLVEVVLPQKAVEPEIDQRLFLGQRLFLAQARSAVSVGGTVLGMSKTQVTPPAAAAAEPVPKSSFWVIPGSRKCTCTSMQPGSRCRPSTSISRAACGGSPSPPARSALRDADPALEDPPLGHDAGVFQQEVKAHRDIPFVCED